MRIATLRPLLAALLLAASASALAFCPKNGFVCYISSKSGGSLTHEDITQRSIEALDKRYFGVPRLTKSMQKALDDIIEANAAVDEDQSTAAKHFDSESASAAQLRLATLKQNVLDALHADPINASGARFHFGSALHTIQDFYSHSNWVELGNSGAHPDLARAAALGFAGPAATVCSGFVDTGMACANSSILVGTLLTSGYYNSKPGAFKCSHGGPLDKSSPASDPLGYFREGINKDTRYCDISPHSGYHSTAAGAAIAATQQFLEDIKAEISFPQLKALLGVGGTLAFAIDTTGSMGGVIAGVRASATSIVDGRLGTDEEPLQYVLAAFNDPGVGPTVATSDAAIFKGLIGGLYASGGGDCPELAMQGLYNGLSLADPGGDLFLYTDATAKDSYLAGAVLGLAKRKEMRIYPVLFGSCSPITPGFLQAATETGGQLFYLSGGEAAAVTELADLVVRNNVVQVLSVADTYASAKSYSVPVDGSMTRLTVAVSGTTQGWSPTVSLRRPDGTLVTAANASKYLALSSGLIISIDSPVAGAWQLSVGGSAGLTYVNVSGVSELDFSSFKLARFGGQPPHQGLMAIDGEPGPGQAVYALAALKGIASAPQFQLRRKNYSTLAALSLEQDETDGGKFFGPLAVPAESFIAYATGTDSSGHPYQRLVGMMVAPQTVSVTPPSPQDLRPGMTTALTYLVRNSGPAGQFSLSATDERGYISAVSASVLTLGAGETANVTLRLTPPAGALIGSADHVTLAVQSVSDAAVHNSAGLTAYVTGALQVAGRPDFLADIISQETIAPGVVALDLRYTNTGPGTALDLRIAAIKLRTLSGTGTVTLNTALSPALPFVTPNVDVGSYITVRLLLNVPAGVQRFSLSQSGTLTDIAGAAFNFSHAQSIIPR